MRVYEAFVELGAHFEDRRPMFRARIVGDTKDYDNYIVLENKFLKIVLDAMKLVSSNKLNIFHRECFDDESELFQSLSSDGLVTREILIKENFSGKEEIEQVLRYLCRDLGFITLGEIGKILIIPGERLNFLLCLPSDKDFVNPCVIEIDTPRTEEFMVPYGIHEVDLP